MEGRHEKQKSPETQASHAPGGLQSVLVLFIFDLHPFVMLTCYRTVVGHDAVNRYGYESANLCD